ncbi:dimethylamine monooxygenase subunit DmmA family protein [Pseudaminobacter sp. NGMCC 1.201702]|uniref:dimethylamine monooxygenase subunit DmmA family protein n=1 Tax=Pseudaminobacter sp. NGMCC 1.201702 TaxID=3391825 RepID=UPI0039EFDB4A
MTASTFFSRPVYGTLSPKPGKLHLFIADDAGASAILDLAKRAPADFFANARIMLISGGAETQSAEALKALKPDQFYHGPSFASALPRLRHMLTNAHMGMRLYLSGSEGLIGQAMQVAVEAGIDYRSIQTEHRGTLARRVQCVHCKGITEDVTTQPATCSHCGLILLVRDHYSRRIAAFQGVCINAEDPNDVPPTEEIFR